MPEKVFVQLGSKMRSNVGGLISSMTFPLHLKPNDLFYSLIFTTSSSLVLQWLTSLISFRCGTAGTTPTRWSVPSHVHPSDDFLHLHALTEEENRANSVCCSSSFSLSPCAGCLIHSIETELSVASHHMPPPPPRMRNWNVLCYIILETDFTHTTRQAVLPLMFPR